MTTSPTGNKSVDDGISGQTPRSAEYLESMLWSMLVGAIWVPFVRWPLALLSFVSDTPRAAVRVFRILGATAALLALITLPSVYVWQFEAVNAWGLTNGLKKAVDFVTSNADAVKAGCIAWTLVTFVGSITAARYFLTFAQPRDEDTFP